MSEATQQFIEAAELDQLRRAAELLKADRDLLAAQVAVMAEALKNEKEWHSNNCEAYGEGAQQAQSEDDKTTYVRCCLMYAKHMERIGVIHKNIVALPARSAALLAVVEAAKRVSVNLTAARHSGDLNSAYKDHEEVLRNALAALEGKDE